MSAPRRTATGSFAVDIVPRSADADTDPLGQLGLRKTWSGDVEGTGRGLMISGGDPAHGIAGYVAMEVVAGTVHGRAGSFALQQFGVMRDGEAQLVYEIVPGSGTEGLAGISGVLDLEVSDAGHHYELSYELPETPAGEA